MFLLDSQLRGNTNCNVSGEGRQDHCADQRGRHWLTSMCLDSSTVTFPQVPNDGPNVKAADSQTRIKDNHELYVTYMSLRLVNHLTGLSK